MAIACIKQSLNTLCDDRRDDRLDAKKRNTPIRTCLNGMDSFMDECLPKNTQWLRHGCDPEPPRT